MKIDSSRYTMFWSNPERYRLREIWKLSPKEPPADSFAALLTFGRRRGTCLHEMRDARYYGRTLDQAAQELRDGGFGEKEIAVARQMAEKIEEAYPHEQYLAHECLFEWKIPDSPHSMVGRIDGIVDLDGEVFILDWKSSKPRSKADRARKLEEYCRGAQVSFYLLGARSLGFEPRGFEYRLVSSGRDNSGVQIDALRTNRTGLELAKFARGVSMTCDLIEFMKEKFGVQRSWPTLPEVFKTGYEGLEGSLMFDDFVPEGYEPRREHLVLMEAQNGV